MAVSEITTEAGDIITQESVAGISNASVLNDTNVETIYTDDLSVNPLTNGWLIGSGWSWSAGNHNMQ